VNAASVAREAPALSVIEDAHWIDEVSESMLAEFLTVIPQTPSVVLATYRPEYERALARAHGAHTIALAPLSDSEAARRNGMGEKYTCRPALRGYEDEAVVRADRRRPGFGVSYLAFGPWAVAPGAGTFRSAALELQIKHQPPKRGAVIVGLATGVSGSRGGGV
jgi:hypothetical protein